MNWKNRFKIQMNANFCFKILLNFIQSFSTILYNLQQRVHAYNGGLK